MANLDVVKLLSGVTEACDVAFVTTKCIYEADPDVSSQHCFKFRKGVRIQFYALMQIPPSVITLLFSGLHPIFIDFK
jgi:hypothetical protein